MNKNVMCVVPDRLQAEAMLAALRDVGFESNDLSVLFLDTTLGKEFAAEHHTREPDEPSASPYVAIAAASTGGYLGGAIGIFAGIGALAIPGLGPLFAAGPILGALTGAAAGAAIGGIAGGLVGLGIPESEAARYEGWVNKGYLLLSVHADTHDKMMRAKQVFERQGGEEIYAISGSYEDEAPSRRPSPEERALANKSSTSAFVGR